MLPRYIRYTGSSYKIASGNSFLKTVFNKGNYGEFLTFSYLEKLGGYHKLMTNLYLPKEDGTTTEIDLIMISETGIYVFESKNYSGWIFGDEKNKNWTQTLQNKQKNHFFNPILQNKGHIKALKSVVKIDKEDFYKSYIIFSERCTLKKVKVTSPNVKVIKRNALIKTIKQNIQGSSRLMTKEAVNQLYLKLKKYTCADEDIKKAHVKNIKLKKS
jgi:hypothetical protein